MSINRKNFLKTVGGVSLGLLAGPLVAGPGYAFGASTASDFTLTRNEEKHLAYFFKQIRSTESPLSEQIVRGFQPARLVKRESRIRSYNLEYISKDGTKIVLARKKGKLVSRVF
jgi:hypothetical protein